MAQRELEKRAAGRFDDLTFEDFRRLAGDDSLTPYEKIGFPDSYRAGAARPILEDILSKLPALAGEGKRFLDIGPGCTELPRMLLELCERRRHEVVLVDSSEMLAHLPDAPHVTKVAGAFPDAALPADAAFDAILAYSVLQYVHAEADAGEFLDRALALLAPGGAMLIGDVPNESKRRRFFASPVGVAFHKRFMGTDEPPVVDDGPIDPKKIDDAVVLGLLARARAAGCDAYVVPQRDDLPLANRREDVLVVRP